MDDETTAFHLRPTQHNTDNMSSSTLLSQELFDETILENEEAFDLSPEEALKETVDQFLSQLGLGGVVCSADLLLGDHHDDDDDSGAVTNGAATEGGGLDVAAADGDDGIDTPPRTTTTTTVQTIPTQLLPLSHLILSHPHSSHGKHARLNRSHFQTSLELLDGLVGVDGKIAHVALAGSDDKVKEVVAALENVGRHSMLGDYYWNEECGNECARSVNQHERHSSSSPLPYLAIFQRTSSIYTLMSFLSVVDPDTLSNSITTLTPTSTCSNNNSLTILQTTIRTISSILSSSPNHDDKGGKCALIRGELRDVFVPALGRVVGLIGGFVSGAAANGNEGGLNENGSTMDNSTKENDDTVTTITEKTSILTNLLQLGTNATRGCESGKVAFVLATVPESMMKISKRGGVAVLVACLSLAQTTPPPPPPSSTTTTTTMSKILIESCNLLSSLCRYDDFRDPSASTGGAIGAAGVNTSSAHDHAMEFHRAGVESLLVKIAKEVLSQLSLEEGGEGGGDVVVVERLAIAVLTALRVLAVNDEIIQTMVALGLLPVVTKALQLGVTVDESTTAVGVGDNATNKASTIRKQRLTAASLGLLRNLCGNDEIKTNLCLGSSEQTSPSSTPSTLPYLLQAMQIYPSIALLQEHACGTLAAMALRRPANARAIIESGGPRLILLAMKLHEMNVNVQRQGALAVRNIVSRLLRETTDGSASTTDASPAGIVDERSTIRDAFLELGAEDTLRSIAGRHQGSVDEAYAALRDLGCTVSLVKFDAEDLQSNAVKRPMMFGEKHNSNFRPVFDDSEDLTEGLEGAASQFGASV